jgi:uncharacterized membrane protein
MSINSGALIGATVSSGIEFLEIVAIAYALRSTGYRREALFGSVAGVLGVALAGALVGPELVLFPSRWLRDRATVLPDVALALSVGSSVFQRSRARGHGRRWKRSPL